MPQLQNRYRSVGLIAKEIGQPATRPATPLAKTSRPAQFFERAGVGRYGLLLQHPRLATAIHTSAAEGKIPRAQLVEIGRQFTTLTPHPGAEASIHKILENAQAKLARGEGTPAAFEHMRAAVGRLKVKRTL